VSARHRCYNLTIGVALGDNLRLLLCRPDAAALKDLLGKKW